ncbi:LCP family protein [Streptomyces sp. NPDC005438]|uniref:LCP family protein n=1 Tax=Streptomyces sp. NPDC005438 TaxID=3156880 RepID=UPI0033BA7DBC
MADDGRLTDDGHPSGALAHSGDDRARRRRILRWAAVVTVAVFAMVAVAAGLVYAKLNDNLVGVDIDAIIGGDRPADTDNGSLDLLVLGSDTRTGENARYGQDEGNARSDTAMVVHVNEARDRASVVSIPRDTLVTRPACRGDQGEGSLEPERENTMFNEAYQLGGPACAVKTVEKLTGIRMDHYLEIDFTGFRRLVDELGGVEITTSEPIHDAKSHLDLQAGTHMLSGEQALGLVRTRKSVGDGSDLGRIKLQQRFVRSLMDRVDRVGLWGNPQRLYRLADRATSSLTTDSGLDNVPDLIGMARSMRDIKSRDVQMVTLPVAYDRDDPNRVVPLEAQGRKVWRALKADRPIPVSATQGSAAEKTGVGGVLR